MTSITPARLLAKELTRRNLPQNTRAAAMAGITERELFKAAAGRRISIVAYLRLCAALDFDPCPDLPHPRIKPADFDRDFFAMGFYMARGIKRHDLADAAQALGVELGTVERLERACDLTVGVVFRAANYIGMSPFGYCKPLKRFENVSYVSRETEAIGEAVT